MSPGPKSSCGGDKKSKTFFHGRKVKVFHVSSNSKGCSTERVDPEFSLESRTWEWNVSKGRIHSTALWPESVFVPEFLSIIGGSTVSQLCITVPGMELRLHHSQVIALEVSYVNCLSLASLGIKSRRNDGAIEMNKGILMVGTWEIHNKCY